jgi:2-dehydro-3-deoxyphosphooctonate aldolase (KDO 8-P synthase)
VADVLQIPAFLCRQTDLLLESGKTGKPINIKKAQFLSANDMQNVIHKVESTGNKNIMLCERGTMFGYNNLVVDFRNIYDMLQFGYPVVMDATHSTQRPGGSGYMSGGDPKYAPYLAKSSIIFGATGLFFEVHPNPPKALSDSKTMINLGEFYKVLVEMKKLHNFVINSL